jgi:hypothetical protein
MQYIFDVDMVGNPTKEQNPWKPDKYFTSYMEQHPYPNAVDPFLYNVRRDTHKGSLDAVLKYDVVLPDANTLNHDLVVAAIADTKQDYWRLEDRGKILPEGSVLINERSSPGPVYKSAGCEDKVEAYVKFPWLMDWFWENAHKCNYPILWKEFGKVELLKTTKATRGISVAPADMQLAGARMNQDTNNLMSELGNLFDECPSRVGMTMQGGGLNEYAKWLDGLKGKKTSSDADKYDARIMALLFDVVKRVRFFMWDKKGMSEQEWWDRQNYYYDQKLKSFILTSNGQVFLKFFGNPSGQDSTTYDNTIIHAFLKNYMWRRLTGLMLSPEAYYEKKIHYRCGLYGDDNNESISEKYAHCYTYERRAAAYAEFGMVLSKDKDVESNSIDGHVWLGKTIKKTPFGYVGVVNENKSICSLRNLEDKETEPGIILTRTIMLMVEATWTEPLQTYIRNYVRWLCDHKVRPYTQDEFQFQKWLQTIPTLESCKRFWMGWECPN